MFEPFSERARRVVFLSRKCAGRRGAAEIGVPDLIEALVVEDQGDFLKAVSVSTTPVAPVPGMPRYRAFLTAETTAEIRRRLEPLMPANATPLPESVDMPISDALKDLFAAMIQLSEELRDAPPTLSRIQVGAVEPLHMLAVVLSNDTSAVAEVLSQAGVTKEAVMTAIENGGYS